jgi:hypothetical protein
VKRECVRMGCGNSVFYGLVCEICLTQEIFELNKTIFSLENNLKPKQRDSQEFDNLWADR